MTRPSVGLRSIVVALILALLATACGRAEVPVTAGGEALLAANDVGAESEASEQASAAPPATETTTPAAPETTDVQIPAQETAPVDEDGPEDAVAAEVEPVEEEAPIAPNANQVIGAAESELRSGVYRDGGNPGVTLAQLLDQELPTVGGEPVDLNQYLGQDVVLWFWAPWCSWCNSEASRVKTVASEFTGDVEVVGIAGVSDEESMQSFVDRHELHEITHLADLTGEFWLSLDVTYQPWWMFVNDDGTVIVNWQGRLGEEEIRDLMTQLRTL